MHLARLLGKGGADMLCIRLEMRLQVLKEGIGPPALAILARRDGFSLPFLDGRGHRRLAHVRAAARWTGDGIGLDLLVVGADRGEPGVERVPPIAGERVADHDALLLARWTASPAISISNSRPCLIAGIRARASSDAARSISAKTTPGSSPASASTSPQGDT